MILDYLITVSEQVSILFILIAVGFICGKINFMSNSTAKHITDIVLYFVTPCVIINAYQVDFDINILVNLGITAICAFLIHLISIFIVIIFFRDKNINKIAVLRFGTVFSNCGFMSLPLQQAILGQSGILYGAAFIGDFNLFQWSYGVICMSGNLKSFSKRQIILNPGIIGVVIALVLFLFSFKLPTVIATPVKYLAGLNTPLPMLIIGFYLSNSKVTDGLKNKYVWKATILRLIAIPILCIALMYFCGIRDDVLITSSIAVSAPVAAGTTMFATKFNRDTELSVNLVSLTTLLSIVTMSFIVAITQMLT